MHPLQLYKFMEYTERDCPIHGTTRFKGEKQNKAGYIRWRCVACSYARQMKSYLNVKTHLIALHGGACRICGYNRCQDAMDFHHLDRELKAFELSSKSFGRNAKIKEAAKCILLCCRCHRELEAGIATLPDS
jgi:hypothetical protein